MSIVLTIDDGDYELYYLVAPVLKRCGFAVVGISGEDQRADENGRL
ncbi:MAG: hypothetical protein UEB92_08315 [Clostridia bacterium]|nr:hypothetical protein [Clostridia bacterium]